MLWNCKIKYVGSEEWVEEIRVSEGALQLDTKDIQAAISTRLTYTVKDTAIPPTIFKSWHDGKTYIAPTWIEVHPETTKDDIVWIPFQPKPKPEEKKKFQFESSSEKGMFYTVRVNGTKITCDCPGVWRAKERGVCKHIRQVKQELGLQKA